MLINQSLSIAAALSTCLITTPAAATPDTVEKLLGSVVSSQVTHLSTQVSSYLQDSIQHSVQQLLLENPLAQTADVQQSTTDQPVD